MPADPRTPRASLLPAGYSFRLVLMVGALVLIGATIYNLRGRAREWQVAEAAAGNAAAEPGRKRQPWKETIVPGPAEDDPVEMAEAQRLFEGVFDKRETVASDTPAYYRLLKWARSRSFAELLERARSERDVPFVALFKEPEKHRGEIIRLRLHVKRAMKWPAQKDNSAGVENVYELWGVTDDSIANLYAVACSELPPGISLGATAESEVVFVGYFLKVLAYAGGDNENRGAPLLIGRVKPAGGGKSVAVARTEGLLAMVTIGAGIVVVALLAVWLWIFSQRKRRPRPAAVVPSLPDTNVEAWLQNPVDADAPGQPSQTAPSTNGASHADGE